MAAHQVMKILIVDGSRDQRLHLVQVLGAVSNVVILGAVADMRSALHAVVEASPDVIVMGDVLPDGDGAELIASVRRLERSPSFVVIGGASMVRDRYVAIGVDRLVDTSADPYALQVAVTTLRRRPTGSIPPEETQRLLGRMTSGIVHDINNYLHVVDVTLALLRRHPDDAQLWTQAQSAVESMTRMSSTLLAYARGGTSEPALVDLGTIARSVIAVLGRVLPPDIAIRFAIADGVPPVHGVRSELEQLVLNLVINACDAMPDGGELVLAVRATPDAAVVLELTDTGTGRAAPSFAGFTRSTKREGAGLGLGIVESVVEHHRGTLAITQAGAGTRVMVTLPPTTE